MNSQEMNELQNYIFASVISADNDEYGLTEDDKQEIISRHSMGSTWEYTLEPIKDNKKRKALIEFFENEDDQEDIRTLHGRSTEPKRRSHKEVLEDA